MSQSEATGADFLESVLPRYRAEGFDVYINPSPSILPPFMQTYRPDAIALRPDKKIAIEVVRSSGPSDDKVRDLESLFAAHGEWELKVFYVSTMAPEKAPDVASTADIDRAIRRVVDLKSEGHKIPALVMAWAALEAVARALLPEQLKRPQTASSLIEALAEEGYLTPQEADALRPAISLRNAAVHGSRDPELDQEQLDHFIAVLSTLAEFLSRHRASEA